ncbi:hypothetical protein DY037_08045 [Apilactobacillus micheneri]|uniref:hypothetical protein n=1 Tax=Apilactobacillus micheneri TaxID=1899430 RepID=UPI00112AB2D4|nr:hypothetical protein [Apilactobacillus micheneri]TPR47829.1 hypothetical protein DY037_08045 [Apilactobacillus micheneri]
MYDINDDFRFKEEKENLTKYERKLNDKIASQKNNVNIFFIDKLVITGKISTKNMDLINTMLLKSNKLDKKNSINTNNDGQSTRKKYSLVDIQHHIFFDGSQIIQTGEEITGEDSNGNNFIIPETDIKNYYQNLKQKMYIETIPNKNEKNFIKVTINPNRFVGDTQKEEIIRILKENIIDLIEKPRIGHIDLNMDTPYNIKYFNLKYLGNKKVNVTNKYEQRNNVKIDLSKTIEVNPNSHEMNAIIYDKVRERLNSSREDDSYISRSYAKRLYNEGMYITRFEIRLLKANVVKKFINNPKDISKCFDLKYRNTSNEGLLFVADNYTPKPLDKRQDFVKLSKSEGKKSYKQIVQRELKKALNKLKDECYINADIINNTINY